jgi:hypothetical protein
MLGTLVMGLQPGPDTFTEMPGCVVPDEQQGLLAILSQALGDPRQVVTGDLADGPSVDEAQEHRVRLRQAYPLAREGFGVRVSLKPGLFHEAQGLVVSPRGHRRLGQAAPPDFVLESQGEGGTRGF